MGRKKAVPKTENEILKGELEEMRALMAQLLKQKKEEDSVSSEMPIGDDRYSSIQMDQLKSIGTGRSNRVDLKLAKNEIQKIGMDQFEIAPSRPTYKKVMAHCSKCGKKEKIDPALLARANSDSGGYRCNKCNIGT